MNPAIGDTFPLGRFRVFQAASGCPRGEDERRAIRSIPAPPLDPVLDSVPIAVDPVLTPLGFAPGQAGASDRHGQVIFCRGFADSADGACVDLVVDLEAAPDWPITDVRYWGYPSERWHLAFDPEGDLAAQLTTLSRTLPDDLA